MRLLQEFYAPFDQRLREAQADPSRVLEGETFPKFGGQLLERFTVFGKFAGCAKYPDCDYTRDLLSDVLPRVEPKKTGEACPECGKDLLVRQGRRGQEFIGCSGYPGCKYTRPLEGDKQPRPKAISTDIVCDKCGKELVVRFGRRGPFLGCSGYPKCRNTRNLTDEEKAKWVPPREDEQDVSEEAAD